MIMMSCDGGKNGCFISAAGVTLGWAELRYDRAVVALSVALSQLHQKPR